jgi:hypothetical protein
VLGVVAQQRPSQQRQRALGLMLGVVGPQAVAHHDEPGKQASDHRRGQQQFHQGERAPAGRGRAGAWRVGSGGEHQSISDVDCQLPIAEGSDGSPVTFARLAI